MPNKFLYVISFFAGDIKLSLVKQRKGKGNALFGLPLRVTTHRFLISDILFSVYICVIIIP